MKFNLFQSRFVQITKFFVVALSISGTLAPGFAAQTPRPNWAKGGGHANESYLVRTGVASGRTLNDDVFDARASVALRSEYEARTEADEARANAGLVSRVDEKPRFQAMRDFAHRAFDTMSKIRLKLEGDKITRAAQNSNLPREPIAAAVLTASLYTGRSMRFRILNGTPVDTRVVLKDKVAQVTVPFASLGATATLAYNHAGEVCASDNGCALLSKSIAPNVSAELNSAEKGSARLVYSVSF